MTKTTRKTICIIVLITFIAALVVFFAIATEGFVDWNGKAWFNYWGKGSPAVVAVVDTSSEQTTPETSMYRAASNSGIIHDSEDSITTVSIPVVPVPSYKKTTDGILFYVDDSSYTDFTGWKIQHSTSIYDYDDDVSYQLSTLQYSDFSEGSFFVPFSHLYIEADTQNDSKYQNLNLTANEIVVEISCRLVHSDGYMGNVSTVLVFSHNEGPLHAFNYSVDFDDTIVSITSYFNDNLTNGTWNDSIEEWSFPSNRGSVANVGYFIGVFDSDVDVDNLSINNGLEEIAIDYFSGYDFFLNYRKYSFDETDSFVFPDPDDGSYCIDLTRLSFVDELHDLCKIVIIPYALFTEWRGENYLIETVNTIEPIYFSISQLKSPTNIHTENGTLMWDEVEGANGYAVFIEDKTTIVYDPKYSLLSLSSGEHTVRIRALGNIGQSLATSEITAMSLTPYNASNVVTQMVMLSYSIGGDIVSKFVPYGVSLSDYLYEVDIPNKEFGGWYYDDGYSIKVENSDKLTSDVTIYARLTDVKIMEQTSTWWERNRWYVLIPCIAGVSALIIFGVVYSVIQKRKGK